jgi:hypothetical protein
MRIDIYHHSDSDEILTTLQRIERKMEALMATLDDTLSAVTAQSTVDDSIITLLNGLAAQIAAGGLSPADQAKVDQIFAAVNANAAKITAAVSANTPVTPTQTAAAKP